MPSVQPSKLYVTPFTVCAAGATNVRSKPTIAGDWYGVCVGAPSSWIGSPGGSVASVRFTFCGYTSRNVECVKPLESVTVRRMRYQMLCSVSWATGGTSKVSDATPAYGAMYGWLWASCCRSTCHVNALGGQIAVFEVRAGAAEADDGRRRSRACPRRAR